MSRSRCLFAILIVTALVAVGAGCAKKKPPADLVPEPVVTAEEAEPVAPPEERPRREVVSDFPAERPTTAEIEKPTVAELNARGVLRTVYFGFDRSDLTDETRRLLRANAEWLKANEGYRVVIEGHCDERGSIEYNLALGQRRARAVREYLSSLGVSASTLRSVSYGEERPADRGHDERAWSRNRRAVFVIEG